MKTNFQDFVYEFVMSNPTLRTVVKNTTVAPLYHAITHERAIIALTENKLGGYSIQRYWRDGRRRKDDEEGYESGLWMRGISLTRDVDFAKSWNDVIFVFDQEKLKTKYKLLPYNWGYSIGGGYIQGSKAKREREEFLITGISSELNPKTGKHYKQKYRRYQEFDKMYKTPNGYIEPLDKYLIGFFISNHFIDILKKYNKNQLTLLNKNDKFLGYY